MAVHQFLPTFEPGAIGNDALAVQKVLRANGHESEIFAEYVRPPFEARAHVHTQYGKSVGAHGDDVLIYHMALGSNVADWLNDRGESLVLRHHNITPVEYYSPWPDANTYGMAWGRNQLRKLVKRTELGCGVSQFNRRELDALRYTKTALTPLILDFKTFDHEVDTALVERLGNERSGSQWLFVGWVAPHKCQHDIIRSFALYRRLYDPYAKLWLVGRAGLDSYWSACEQLVAALDLEESVVMTGRVSDAELGAYYKNADVLVSMSEHEGVGIPLLEAMHHRLPIVAYASAAVPETVGNAGVLVARKRPAVVAAAVDRLVSDAALRSELATRSSRRLEAFDHEVAARSLLTALGRWKAG